MTSDSELTGFVTENTESYEVAREVIEEMLSGADDSLDVDAYQSYLILAIVAGGSRDADLFAPLLPAAVRQVAELDRTGPDRVQPNLAVLNVLNQLQMMGSTVPETTMRTAAAWLPGMQTAGLEPRWMHWNRGLAALALGDLRTARTLAALPADGSGTADPHTSPGYSMQAWFALFVVAVERRLPWKSVRPRWAEYLTELPGFIEVGVQSSLDLAWAGRIMGHEIAGVPLGETADWIRDELANAGA